VSSGLDWFRRFAPPGFGFRFGFRLVSGGFRFGFRFGFRLVSAGFRWFPPWFPPLVLVSAWFPLVSVGFRRGFRRWVWFPRGFRWLCVVSARAPRSEHLVSASPWLFVN
jgi:hypothetical protein